MALRAVPCLSRAKFRVSRAGPFGPARKYRTSRSQGGRFDAGGRFSDCGRVDAEGWRSSHVEDAGRSGSGLEQEI
jgi:hypothetical protein